MGGSTLDDLVAGLARVALKPLVGLFTEGIICKVNGQFGQESRPIGGRVGAGGEAGSARGAWEYTETRRE